MKILIVFTVCLLATVYCQQQQRRQHPQQQQQQYQQDQVQQDQYQQEPQPKQYQQPAQQNYEHNNARETTTFIPIIRFDKEQGADGSYKHAWETGNNIIAEETGFLKNVPSHDKNEPDGHAQVQHGSYSYTAPDGQLITIEYTADENGFQPQGLHLPTPPPVSPEVQKGLDLIYAGIEAQRLARERDPEGYDRSLENNNGFYRGE